MSDVREAGAGACSDIPPKSQSVLEVSSTLEMSELIPAQDKQKKKRMAITRPKTPNSAKSTGIQIKVRPESMKRVS